jgi:hypothetical protein
MQQAQIKAVVILGQLSVHYMTCPSLEADVHCFCVNLENRDFEVRHVHACIEHHMLNVNVATAALCVK